jgi:hypothetical protein
MKKVPERKGFVLELNRGEIFNSFGKNIKQDRKIQGPDHIMSLAKLHSKEIAKKISRFHLEQ